MWKNHLLLHSPYHLSKSLPSTYVLGGKLGIVADKKNWNLHRIFLLMETNAYKLLESSNPFKYQILNSFYRGITIYWMQAFAWSEVNFSYPGGHDLNARAKLRAETFLWLVAEEEIKEMWSIWPGKLQTSFSWTALGDHMARNFRQLPVAENSSCSKASRKRRISVLPL